MKKLLSLITAAAAVLAAVPMSASAAADDEEHTYCPTVYFNADAKEPVLALPGGNLYVNTEKSTDSVISVPAKVFLKDQYNHVGMFFLKWTWDTDYVYTSGIRNPSSEGGSAAYTEYNVKADGTDPVSYYNVEGEKMMGITYSNTHNSILTPSGETSDSNPVGLFELNIAKNAPADYYSIDFRTEYPDITNIVLRYPDENDFKGRYPSGETAPSLKIGVSDRDLGDVNKDNVIDGRDASAILTEYALLSANKDGSFNKAQAISADVTGNNIVDGIDATNVLTYYALTSSGSTQSFIDFLNK